MQTSRDAATLAVLILLALTVRVEVSGAPIDLDLGTTAEASAEAPSPVEPTPEPAAQPASECFRSEVKEPLAAFAVPASVLEHPMIERRQLVLEIEGINGKRAIVVLGGEEPGVSLLPPLPPAAPPEPCDDSCKSHLSC
jgi:hypothetical protein